MNGSHSFIRITMYMSVLILCVFLVSACGTESNSGSEKLFDSGNIAPEGTFSFTVEEEGTLDYYCEIHAPNMLGEITVSSSAENSNPDTVEMVNSQFNPSQITVAPNTEIVWINADITSHTVVSGNPQTDNGGGY